MKRSNIRSNHTQITNQVHIGTEKTESTTTIKLSTESASSNKMEETPKLPPIPSPRSSNSPKKDKDVKPGKDENVASVQKGTEDVSSPEKKSVSGESSNGDECVSREDVKKTATSDIVLRCKDEFRKVLEMEDFTTNTIEELSVLKTWAGISKSPEEREMIGDAFLQNGALPCFKKVWRDVFQKKADYFKGGPAFDNLLATLVFTWNCSDISHKFAQGVLETDIPAFILKTLPKANTSNKREAYRIRGILGIFHNCLRLCDGAKQQFRELGMMTAMQDLRQGADQMMQMKIDINLAYLINENEHDIIKADGIKLLIKILADAMESKNHKSKKYGFGALESMQALKKLSANDANKVKVVEYGALPLCVKMMGEGFDAEEKAMAASTIWSLAFSDACKMSIKSLDGCLGALRQLASSSKDSAVKKAAKGALWTLEDQSAPSLETKKENSAQHVMISYNWGSQAIMLRVSERLKQAGIKIWMDVDNMSGSTLEAMAHAVENSSVVLIGMTQKYQESAPCRSEAEYTYKKKKPFIPLLLQSKYEPDGWLGIMVGTALYFDFAKEEKFERSIAGLIKEIGNKGKLIADGPDSPVVNGIEPKHVTPIRSLSLQSQPRFKQVISHDRDSIDAWTPDKVQEWLKKHKFLNDGLKEFDGEMLMELKDLWRTAPDFFFNSLKQDLGMKLPEILKFTRMLRKL